MNSLPNVIIKSYQDINLLKNGQSVKLVCEASANPPPTNYSWFINEKKVKGALEEHFEIEKVSDIHHEAEVKCVAHNFLGSGSGTTTLKRACRF